MAESSSSSSAPSPSSNPYSSSQDDKYKDLPRNDEPPILQHGGKLVRDYVEEALSRENDYDFAALLMNCVTNGAFKHLFEVARSGFLGVHPRWGHMPRRPKVSDPRPDWHDFGYASSTNRAIYYLHNSGKGLAPLIALEGSPTDLRVCGKIRLARGIAALQEHPTLKYILHGVGDIADLNHRLSSYGTGLCLPWDKHFLTVRRDVLVKSLEKAVFTGDLGWLKRRYDTAVSEEEARRNDNDDDIKDDEDASDE